MKTLILSETEGRNPVSLTVLIRNIVMNFSKSEIAYFQTNPTAVFFSVSCVSFSLCLYADWVSACSESAHPGKVGYSLKCGENSGLNGW